MTIAAAVTDAGSDFFTSHVAYGDGNDGDTTRIQTMVKYGF